MWLNRDWLWKFGVCLLIAGVGGVLVLAVIVGTLGDAESTWIKVVGNTIGISFIVGALITWIFAFRFYARVHRDLGVTRSAVYLAILICGQYLAPFIFIWLEGRARFFGEPDNKTEGVG